MNTLMAGGRRADAHHKRTKGAKDKATPLLAGVPDPGGVLKAQIEACDDEEWRAGHDHRGGWLAGRGHRVRGQGGAGPQERLAAASEFEAALAACVLAAATDPTSKAGVAAAAKSKEIQADPDAARAKRAAEAAAEEARRSAEVEAARLAQEEADRKAAPAATRRILASLEELERTQFEYVGVAKLNESVPCTRRYTNMAGQRDAQRVLCLA